MELLSTLSDQTGSQKSNMAAAKPEVLMSQVLDKTDMKFQKLHPHFRGLASQWSCCQHCRIKPEVRNKDGGFIPQYKQQLHRELNSNNVGVALEFPFYLT